LLGDRTVETDAGFRGATTALMKTMKTIANSNCAPPGHGHPGGLGGGAMYWHTGEGQGGASRDHPRFWDHPNTDMRADIPGHYGGAVLGKKPGFGCAGFVSVQREAMDSLEWAPVGASDADHVWNPAIDFLDKPKPWSMPMMPGSAPVRSLATATFSDLRGVSQAC
jgi:hypothetical protein